MPDLDCGRPTAGADFRRHLTEILSSNLGEPTRLLAGFAYATRAGVNHLLNAVEDLPAWPRTRKQWLLGVHHGITEPSAIAALADTPRSEVRLAVCGLSLSEAVAGQRIFHAKVIAVDAARSGEILAVIAGSANLTSAAIGGSARNYEMGIAWKTSVGPGASQHFAAWWKEAWSSGVRATATAVERYIKQRDKFLLNNPGVLLETSQHLTAELENAAMLWIDAGMMSGGARNQVEFNTELTAFFGPVSSSRRYLVMTHDRRVWSDRPLSPKETTFGVSIWRLSLPTEAQGGFEYPGRVICIEKLEGDDGTRYRLDVADAESAKARGWREETHRAGVVGRTGGGRNYGFI